MVQVNQKIKKRVGFVDDGTPLPLYTKFHRNTVQRDLIDQGYYVDVETHQPVREGYNETKGNYAPGELPEPQESIERLRADLEEFGYCLVADALSAEQLAMFRQRVDEQAAGERAALVGTFSAPDENGVSTNQFLQTLVNKGQCFADAVEMSERGVQKGGLLEQLTTEMLGRDFICNSAAAALAGPGGSPQALHCGQSMIPKPWPPWPYECFVGFLLDEFTTENGGTLVIPRSHRILSELGTDPIEELPPTANVTAPAGTSLVMDGRLAHGTGTNFTDTIRRLIILTFHKPFVRQQEQWMLSLAAEVYETASPKLLQRSGFNAWHGGLGGYEGHGEGSTAPLRDGYVPVGELGPDGTSDVEFSARRSRGAYSEKELARMQDRGQLIVRGD